MADILRRSMKDERVPAELRDPANWPAPMRAEWGDDEGLAAAARHRAALVDGFGVNGQDGGLSVIRNPFKKFGDVRHPEGRFKAAANFG